MSDDIKKLGEAINRLVDEGRIKKGERRFCLTLDLQDLKEADKVADEAITKAKNQAKQE